MSIKKYDLYVYAKWNGAVRIYGNYTDILNFVWCFVDFDSSVSGEDRLKVFDKLIKRRKRQSKRNYYVDMDELYAVRAKSRNRYKPKKTFRDGYRAAIKNLMVGLYLFLCDDKCDSGANNA